MSIETYLQATHCVFRPSLTNAMWRKIRGHRKQCVFSNTLGADIVVKNAGFGLLGAVEEVEEAQARKLFDTNFFGTFHVIHAGRCCVHERAHSQRLVRWRNYRQVRIQPLQRKQIRGRGLVRTYRESEDSFSEGAVCASYSFSRPVLAGHRLRLAADHHTIVQFQIVRNTVSPLNSMRILDSPAP